METHDNLLASIDHYGKSEEFERAILQVIASSGKTGTAYCEKICYKDPVSGYFYRDFTANSRNVLALCLKDWRASCGESYIPPDDSVIGMLISKLATEYPDVVTVMEAPQVIDEWKSVNTTNPLLPAALNAEVAGAWMRKQRFERAVKDSHFKITAGGRKLRASQIVERLHKAMDLADLSGMNTNAAFVSIDDILKPAENSIQPTTFYSTGVPVLDKMLGGGYARGYSYLHVTGTGGGKTVHATQMGSNMSLRQDLKCLWISTEEPENEVYYRLLSNFCGIPQDDIRHKMPTGELIMAPVVQARFDLATERMRSNIRVKRWVNEDFNVILDLKSEIQEFEQAMGAPPAYIIFDWLGASTTELASNNGVRNSLKSKAYQMDAVAKQNNLTILFYMQAGERYKNERFINQEHVDECKGAAAKCPAVIGWSFLPNKGDGTQVASNGVHQDQQFMSVGKSRFGKGGFFQFKRNYGVQKMEFPK